MDHQRKWLRAREDLARRAQALITRRGQALAEEDQLLEEREPDWEDLAANRSQAALLERLTESELAQLQRIQASLSRIERGTYGQCIVCHQPISEDRLRAVPEAERCRKCTNAH